MWADISSDTDVMVTKGAKQTVLQSCVIQNLKRLGSLTSLWEPADHNS